MDKDNTCLHILIAEDNPGDVMLIKKALSESDFDITIHTVSDGIEAVRFIRQKKTYAEKPRPDLILMDLNLPRKDGIEVLESMTTNTDLQQTPVIVLTSSGAKKDIVKSYQHQANAYIVKPSDFNGFVDIITRIEEFWFKTAKIPDT